MSPKKPLTPDTGKYDVGPTPVTSPVSVQGAGGQAGEANSTNTAEIRADAGTDSRPEYVWQGALNEAADAFVRAMGWRNADRLSENLRHTIRSSDGLKALHYALVRNFNITRQEQIRREQMNRARPKAASQETALDG